MTTKDIYVALVAAIVGALILYVYDVATSPTSSQPKPTARCSGNPHCIDVVVISVGSAVQIQSIPNHKFKGQGGPIFWDVQNMSGNGVNYTFAAKGIDFYPVPPTKSPQAPAGEFTNCAPTGNGDFKCDDANKTPGAWPYTVTLQGSDATTLTLDPYIINN